MTSQRRLPHEHKPHVVYIARDVDGRALYVGSTHNFPVRRRSHERTKPWAGRIASWEQSEPMPWEDAIVREEQAIAEHKPEFNIQRSAGRRLVQAGIRHLLADERNGVEPTPEQLAEGERMAAAAMERALSGMSRKPA